MNDAHKGSKLWPVMGLCLSAIVPGLAAGSWLGGLLVRDEEGMAGSASVLGYGLVGMLVFVVVALVVARRMERRSLVRLLLFTGALALTGVGWFAWRLTSELNKAVEQDREEREHQRDMKPTSVMFASWYSEMPAETSPPTTDPVRLGMGMVSPSLVPRVLYFYSAPDLLATTGFPEPSDSVVFVQGEYHVEIASAPPWFAPVHLKLDYDLLLLKAITIAQNWIEVEVNMHDGRTAWIHRQDLQLVLWEEFMLHVVAVEVLDAVSNPIRTKAQPDAAVLAEVGNTLLRPIAVHGDWLQVAGYQDEELVIPTGWIRWREGERLLVDYSLLC